MPPERALAGGVYIYNGAQEDGLPLPLTHLNQWDGHTVDSFGNPVDPLFLPDLIPVCGPNTFIPLELPSAQACLVAAYRVRRYTCSVTGLVDHPVGGDPVSYPDQSVVMAPFIPGSDTNAEYGSELDALRLMADANVSVATTTPWALYNQDGMSITARITGLFVSSGTPPSSYFMEAAVEVIGATSFGGAGATPAGVRCTITVPFVGDFNIPLYGTATGSIRITPLKWWGLGGRLNPDTGVPL